MQIEKLGNFGAALDNFPIHPVKAKYHSKFILYIRPEKHEDLYEIFDFNLVYCLFLGVLTRILVRSSDCIS